MNSNTRVGVVIGAIGLGLPSACLAQATFTALGDLGGGDFTSFATGVSADGRVVCGTGTAAIGMEAFVWTADAGMVGLGDLPGGRVASWGVAISDDGTVVAGTSSSSNATFPNVEGFWWTAESGMHGIGVVGHGDLAGSPVRGISADGSVVVGWTSGDGPTQGYLWTQADGFTTLGLVSGDTLGFAMDASNGASRVVGYGARSVGEGGGSGARQYTPDAGWHALFTEEQGAAMSVTADGSMATGRYGSGTTRLALLWSSTDGPAGLPSPAGTDTAHGWDLSADGSVVVGHAERVGDGEPVATIWIDDVGQFVLQELLQQRFGVELPGWTLTKASGVSDDGLVIVGEGRSPDAEREAWRVELPWLFCPADWNSDGVLAYDDFTAFWAGFNAGDADINADGTTDILDFLVFLNAYAAGC